MISLIRKAGFDDIPLIVDTYNEHFQYEEKHGAFTVFRKGAYPTGRDAENAVKAGSLYVYEENQIIAGSIIIDNVQTTEYEKIPWSGYFSQDKVMVIHLRWYVPAGNAHVR